MIPDWVFKVLAALIPLALATLVTVAWQNSHRLIVITNDVEHVETEVEHLRDLVEKQLSAPSAR